jgi:predicted ATPase/class 3 adenylate cyclase/Tfp pilus assembly protein PilF
MADLPAGDVTFLLTDIQGSTALWESEPESMRAAVVRHDAILSGVISACGGSLLKSRGEGDSTFSVFEHAAHAVTAALAVQRALAAEPWPTSREILVRIAMHTGEADLRDGDYFGTVVNRTARLRSIGHGGQTLLSAATRDLVAETLPPRATLSDLGSHRLKDLARPEQVWQLCHADLATDFPPLNSLDPRRHNFPVQLTTFIGRDPEVAEVRRLLSTSRLVTLTGTGGVGKTRLALQASAEVLQDFADGACLVELAALADPELVPEAIASALGVREERGFELTATVAAYLASRRVFLVLDNCEHLIGTCAKVAEKLLLGAPGLCLLATSREPLAVAGEVLYRVPSLATPAPDDSLNALSESDAVRLFVDRAALASRVFTLTDDNARAVADICRRVEGIPLAIELAAARTGVLTPSQIAERLHDRFALLTGGPRTAPTRQQTLRATLDWSYELLAGAEQALLQHLSVFAAGFTLEAAEQVCVAGLEQFQILDLVSALVDKSLVVVEDGPRYSLPESIRQYAAEKLSPARRAELRAAHFEWFLALAMRANAERTGPEQARWLDRLERDHDNFRSALAMDDDRSESDALELAAALGGFWHLRGHWTEGRRLLGAVVADAPDGPLRARAMSWMATLAEAQGDHVLARDHVEHALTIYRGAGDRKGVATSLNSLGSVASARGDLAGARALAEEALLAFREIGDRSGAASCTHTLANVAYLGRDYPRARALYEELLAAHRELGNRRGVATCLNNLGSVADGLGDSAGSRTLHEEALVAFREIGDPSGVATCLHNIGNMARKQGDHSAARPLYDEALAIRREIGDRRGVASSLRSLAGMAYGEGAYAGSRALYEEALAIGREIGDRPGVAYCLSNLRDIAYRRGEYRAARAFAEEALAIRREIGERAGVAGELSNLGNVAYVQGDYAVARECSDEALATYREIGNRQGAAYCLGSLGNVAYAQGELSGARALYEEALATSRETGDQRNAAYELTNLGNVAYLEGDYAGARALYAEALAIRREIVDRRGAAGTLVCLGRLSRRQGRADESPGQLLEALVASRDLDLKEIIAECMEILAGLAADEGDGSRGARLFGAAETIRLGLGNPRAPAELPEHERDVTLVRGLLDEQAFLQAWAQGRAMTLDEATAYARGDARPSS